jgi:hypothetical protein
LPENQGRLQGISVLKRLIAAQFSHSEIHFGDDFEPGLILLSKKNNPIFSAVS